MELLSVREEAAIRRAAYIAVLRGELDLFETREQFAARIGRARVYLESLLDDDGTRTPGPGIAKEIADALPIDAAARRDLLEQMLLAAERRLRLHRRARDLVSEAPPAQFLESLRSMHWSATYSAAPELAGVEYRRLCELGTSYLRRVEVVRQPLAVVEICLLLHDVLSVLNRHGEALVHALAADTIMQRLDRGEYRRARERFDHLRVNASYAEGVTLTSLGLGERAEGRFLRSQAAMRESADAAEFWRPHIARSRLAALATRNRFSLYVAEEFAREVKTDVERRGDPLAEQSALLADVSLGRAYLRYGTEASLRKATRVLREPIERLHHIPDLGPLRRAIALRTYADVCWARGWEDEWAHYLRGAWHLATAARLTHQLAAMRRRYTARLSGLGLFDAADDESARAPFGGEEGS